MASETESWKQTQENAQSEPVFKDEYFRKKPKKHGREWSVVNAPKTSAPISDTHAHLQMLPEPALAIARAGYHGLAFIETMVDPAEDSETTFSEWDAWAHDAAFLIRNMGTRTCGQGWKSLPKIRIAVGVHPHNAKSFDAQMEATLKRLLHDERVSAVGEIGLDYHYDYSPRPVQQEVFAKQVSIAKVAGLPVILHVREAFDDAFRIMEEAGWNDAGVLLHCYTSNEHEIKRWVDAGCYVAFGGAFTFKKLNEVREAAKLVPSDKLLLETDAPFMAPEPFRGATCEPAHTLFTGFRVWEFFDEQPEGGFENPYPEPEDLFQQSSENATALLDRPPTAWQLA